MIRQIEDEIGGQLGGGDGGDREKGKEAINADDEDQENLIDGKAINIDHIAGFVY